MQSKLVILSVIAFALGVGWRTVYEVPISMALWLLVLALGVGLVWRRKGETFSAPYLLSLSLLLCFISLGVIRTEFASWQFGHSPLQSSVGQSVTVTGTILSEPDYRERTVHLYIENEEDKILVTADRHREFSYGDKVRVEGKLERPSSFTTDLGRTFNYPNYLLAKGVEYRISFAEVEVFESGQGNPIIGTLLSMKQSFIASLEEIIPEPEAGLGNGLLLGVRSALGDDIEEDFRRTGIIHIVVLSGFNVMLVVAFIMFVFSFFLPLRWRAVAGVLAIASFALIVGLSATVVRASVMAGLVLLAQTMSRRYDVLRALLLAGVVMIIINPYLLVYDIGFQLSFMATLGLILIIPKFEATLMEKGSKFGLREFFLATVATQIAVLPLLMYHIGEVSLLAVVVNVLVLPIVPTAMFLTFFSGLVGFVSVPLAGIFGFAATLTLTYILKVAEWFSALPFASVTVPQFSALGVFIMYGVMFLVWNYWGHFKKEKDPLEGWTIEIETAGESGPGRAPDSPAELPIFFR